MYRYTRIQPTAAFVAALALLSISCPQRLDDVNVAQAKASGLDYSFVIWAIDLPESMAAGKTVKVPVELINNGKKIWKKNGGPDFLSYHWKHPGGQFDDEMFWGEKTKLPETVGPGELIRIDMAVRAPELPKFYVITIDVVHGQERDREKSHWFEEGGWETYDRMIEVIKR